MSAREYAKQKQERWLDIIARDSARMCECGHAYRQHKQGRWPQGRRCTKCRCRNFKEKKV